MTTPAELVCGVLHLLPLPRAYLRLRELTRDANAELGDIVAIINNDPAMAGRLLQLANGAYYGLSRRVETVARAVTVLGMTQVHDLALAVAAIPAMNEIGGADLAAFWRRSIYCAVSARRLALRAGRTGEDRSFVAGLLHDAGHLILEHRLPEVMAELRDTAIHTQQPLFVLERELLGFDYAKVGGELMQAWQMPASLQATIAGHTRPPADGDNVVETRLVHIASVLARAEVWRSPEDEPVPEFDPQALESVGLDACGVDALMQETDAEVAEAFRLLLPSMRPPPDDAGDRGAQRPSAGFM